MCGLQQTCGSVNVCERDKLVLLRLERRLDVRGVDRRAERRLERVHVRAVRAQAVGRREGQEGPQTGVSFRRGKCEEEQTCGVSGAEAGTHQSAKLSPK